MAMKQDDFIILASNVKSYSETNKASHFKTKLASRKNFSSEQDWRVAITEITYRQSWYNVREKVIIHLLTRDGRTLTFDDLATELTIEPGFYPSVFELLKTINLKLQNLAGRVDKIPILFMNIYSQIVSIAPGVERDEHIGENEEKEKILPILGSEIEKILGLVDSEGNPLSDQLHILKSNVLDSLYQDRYLDIKQRLENFEVKGEYPADISAGLNNIYIYSNIVRQSDVGDAYASILTTVPNIKSADGWGGSVHHEIKNLVYRPLQTRIFDTIEIDIRDDSGRRIPFEFGNVIVKLNFIKNE